MITVLFQVIAAADLLDEPEAADVRHACVCQHQLIWLIPAAAVAQRGDRLAGAGHGHGQDAPTAEDLFQNCAVRGVVVDHQHRACLGMATSCPVPLMLRNLPRRRPSVP